MYEGKFAFQNRSGEPSSWKEIYRFCFVLLSRVEFNFQVKPPPGGGALIFGGGI